jgi:hypothetical protein
MIIDRKPKCQCCLLISEKFDDIGAVLEHLLYKILKHLAQEVGISKGTMRSTTELFKLWPYKTTIVQSLQPCDLVARLNFCNWYLQSVGIFNRLANVCIAWHLWHICDDLTFVRNTQRTLIIAW